MGTKEKKILSRFLVEENISLEDLKKLREWLNKSNEPESVMQEEWDRADTKETNLKFTDIQKEIRKKQVEKDNRGNLRFLLFLQKVAAVLILPVLLFSIYLSYRQFGAEPVFFETTAGRGQKANITLPDGTRVWLNSDTKIIYPDNFGRKNRTVKIFGEAYFEVKKDTKKPFRVEAAEARIKVLGTKFNVRAYPDENEVETTLFEGKVDLTVTPGNENITSRTITMNPGESISFDKSKNVLHYNNFENDEVLGWTNNQLIFRNDSFENLVRKIERWYDVDIVYDKGSLDDHRLTVELYQGELLYRLLDIIELALDVECESKENKIYIKKTEK